MFLRKVQREFTESNTKKMDPMPLPATLQLVRSHNCLFSGFSVIVGTIIASGGQLLPQILPAFTAAALIAGGGNAINDYFDREIDKKNRPDRPIPSGRIKPNDALIISWEFIGIGILAAGLLNIYCVALAGFNAFMLTIYAPVLKPRGLPGNIAIGFMTGSTFLFAGLAVGNVWNIIILAAMAGLATVGREIIKDIEDYTGDKKLKLKTFPIKYGKKKAAYLATAFTIGAIALTPLPYLIGQFEMYYLAIVTISIIAFVHGANTILKSQNKTEARSASQAYKTAMAFGLLAFIIGAALDLIIDIIRFVIDNIIAFFIAALLFFGFVV